MTKDEAVERLAVHSAYGLHLIAKWLSAQPGVDADLKARLATHLMGVDSSVRALGHSAIHEEFEATEDQLRPRS
jgi:hypothetical protein